MKKISVSEFIRALDACFAREDLPAAGACLKDWEQRALALGDRSGELTVQNEAVGYYRQTGEEAPAMAAINRARQLLRMLGAEDTVSGATILLNCATTMKTFGRAREALPLYEQVRRLYGQKLPAVDPLVAGLHNNLGLTRQELGDYEGAERDFRQAIVITEQLPGCELETAVSLVNLAQMRFDLDGEDPQTAPLLERAYDILSSDEYIHYEKYAFTCRKCAPAFGYCGWFLMEKRLQERADAVYARAGAEQSIL